MKYLNIYIIAGAGVSVLSFILDLMTPPYFGLAVIPHFIAVALTVPGRSEKAPWLVAGLSAVFCAFGLVIKSPALEFNLFMFNRFSIMLLLFAMAWLSMKLVTYREDSLSLAAAKLESARQHAFLARINHQFRTPLNAILGFSDIIRRQLIGPIEREKYINYAEDIHRSGECMLALIDDILELKAIETGERPILGEPVAPRKFLQDCSEALQDKIAARGIAVSIDVPKNIPSILADRESLTHMVLNLLTNAIDASDRGGSILMSVESEQQKIIIVVADSGIGIPQDRLDRIFQPFSQGRLDPMVAQNGTGLGLAVANAIVKAHHGVLKVSSKVGKGTIFAVELPLTWR